MSADNLHSRLQSVGTCDALEKYIMRFVRSRNGKTFCGLHCRRSGPDSEEVGPFTRSDWMKANHGRNDILRSFLDTTSSSEGSYLSGAKWDQSPCIKLMEMTHSQWLVRNFLIHDKMSGMLALEGKEELQIAIEEQQESMAGEELLDTDKMSGMLALEGKEELQIAIEEQQEMGLKGLREEVNI
eukprot:CAMPEP_0201741108 /NCGR_PEP_ID=MMETSP0593-20130828/46645_1 /ASSEMBLY_ACC=CAM_ASM_000672 /TAXON_ID=267983 /ORGANISM="Skeletonema japonicum, Strain CCMP2506" /LENGTH=183 /DNA_ID=CAMNT_0048235435 /DNA_START=542 /DNA_END=1095 /DNA_ORIENTATION=-